MEFYFRVKGILKRFEHACGVRLYPLELFWLLFLFGAYTITLFLLLSHPYFSSSRFIPDRNTRLLLCILLGFNGLVPSFGDNGLWKRRLASSGALSFPSV